jgi:hypothetical protein
VTTSARKSWNLSPEDLLDAGYLPSLWAAHKATLRALLAAVLGHLPLRRLTQTDAAKHKRLANAPRKRRPQILYPAISLF